MSLRISNEEREFKGTKNKYTDKLSIFSWIMLIKGYVEQNAFEQALVIHNLFFYSCVKKNACLSA
jgi:hypothetical protein